MSNIVSEFEMSDKVGTTVLYSASVGVGGAFVPAVAGKYIDEISIRCQVDQPAATRLEFSFDGTVWHRLKVGEMREDEPRGTITQVKVRAAGSLATAIYEIAINYGRLP